MDGSMKMPNCNLILLFLLLISHSFAHSIIRTKLFPSRRLDRTINTGHIADILASIPTISDKMANSSKGSTFSTLTAFVTDPALLVTILHSLEVAYWTLPFGVIFKPIMNLFRMPNRRMDTGNNWLENSLQQPKQLLKVINRIRKSSPKSTLM